MSEKLNPSPEQINCTKMVKNGVYGVPLYQLRGTAYNDVVETILNTVEDNSAQFFTLGQHRHFDYDPREIAGKYGDDFLVTEGYIEKHPNPEKVVQREGKVVPHYQNPEAMVNGHCILGDEYLTYTPQQMRSSFDVFDWRQEKAERENGRTASLGGKGPKRNEK